MDISSDRVYHLDKTSRQEFKLFPLERRTTVSFLILSKLASGETCSS